MHSIFAHYFFPVVRIPEHHIDALVHARLKDRIIFVLFSPLNECGELTEPSSSATQESMPTRTQVDVPSFAYTLDKVTYKQGFRHG